MFIFRFLFHLEICSLTNSKDVKGHPRRPFRPEGSYGMIHAVCPSLITKYVANSKSFNAHITFRQELNCMPICTKYEVIKFYAHEIFIMVARHTACNGALQKPLLIALFFCISALFKFRTTQIGITICTKYLHFYKEHFYI